MSIGVLERPATGSAPEPTTGGVPARRAMVRWAWRLFRREWRQQLLILLLVIVAVAAVVVGAAVAVNTPPPANAGYGTAGDLATYHELRGSSPICTRRPPRLPRWSTASARSRSSRTRRSTFPGSIQTYDLRSQDPHGPYGGPMLRLLSGHYPDAGRTRSPSLLGWPPTSISGWATPGLPKAARRWSASCRIPRACSTSSPWFRRGR